MDDLERRKKEEDLIFQEIEEKSRMVDQAKRKHRIEYTYKYLPKLLKTYSAMFGKMDAEAIRHIGDDVIKAADRDFDSSTPK